MSAYGDVLNAVQTALGEISTLQNLSMSFALRKRPSLIPLQDALPQCVISPPADLAEKIFGFSSESIMLEYEVYIGLFFDARWEVSRLEERLAAREAIRKRLHPPKSIAPLVGTIWNSSYNPKPSITFDDDVKAANIDYSWQLFTFIDKQAKGF